MNLWRYYRFSAFSLVFLLLCGCGGQSGATVSGRVTLDGSPVSAGTISFMPVDSKTGQAVGGQIVSGSYLVNGVSAGKQHVNISINPKAENISMAEHAAKAKKYKEFEHSRGRKGEKPPVSELAQVIGNDQIHEIAAGSSQVLNLELHKVAAPEPTSSDRRKR
jgi:hypothetical protein